MSLNFLKTLIRRSTLQISASGRTDTGKKRSRNEDSFCLMPGKNMYIVADGMGGHNAGDVASTTAVDILAQYYIANKLDKLTNQEAIRHTMIAGFIHTNEKIMAMASENKKYQGMGCTMIACFMDHDHAHLCHVGDVRGYFVKANFIRQLTQDHSYAAEFSHNDREKPTGKNIPPKNIVSRAIGFPFHEDPEYNFTRLESGSRIFMCSDGLWGMVNDSQLHEIFLISSSAEMACDSCIAQANKAGGKDNITVVSIFMD